MGAPTTRQPLLDVAGLRVTYGGVVAVSDVDLRVTEGTIYGLIGPNGAGKTSMVDALTGYTRPAAGRIVFDGRDIGALRPYRRARLGLARTFQSVELFDDLTVDENLLVASERMTVGSALRDLFLPHRPPDRAGVDRAISVCGLEDVADRYPSQISLGKRKLVGIGRALARQRDCRLNDTENEPPNHDGAAGLPQDPEHQRHVLEGAQTLAPRSASRLRWLQRRSAGCLGFIRGRRHIPHFDSAGAGMFHA